MQSTKLLLRSGTSVLAMAIATPFLANPAQANPSGGAVTSGSASIANPSSNATQVHQTSEGVVIDWSSFNVGKGQTTTFVQPNAQAIAVNRIGGKSATQIFGTLDANGRIVLINGNGLLFGKGSQVNVGSLVATSSDANDADMLAGKANFTKSGNANAQIVNEGSIAASQGGFVALVAPTVTNRGTVQAKLGNVTLAAANNFTIDFNGDGLVSFAAPAAGRGRVSNSGSLAGATITMDARSAEGAAVGVVNAGGTIVAQGAHLQGGSIVLDGGAGGNIDVSGSLNASGTNGGGAIAVGYSGNSLAGNVTLEKSAVLSADATQSGNGGSVKIDSQNNTRFNGLISAKGAGAAGAGGNVEVSTKGVLQFTGFADTSALSGKAGTLLLDPTDLYINTSGTAPEAGASAISVATLESELAAGNVTLETASPGTQIGNITVAANVSWSSNYSLSLDAYRNVILDNHMVLASLGTGGISLRADDTGRNVGMVNFDGNSSAAVHGGDVSIFYDPADYNTPVNYTGHVNLAGGSMLTAYMLVNNATDLQDIGENATTLAGDYALGRAINLSAYNGGGGFPIIGGIVQLPFTGIFNGEGLAISHLQITNGGNNVGLFYEIGTSGSVSDLPLTAVSVTGGNYTGALAGENFGTIDDVTVTGTVNGGSDTGGLVGANSGTIVSSSMNGAVSGANNVGGLVGSNSGDIDIGSTKGTVVGTDYSGGVAGYNSNIVNNSSSSDPVTGSDDVGGLVGEDSGGSINASHATGKVSGSTELGGLVGLVQSGATITSSYAAGTVMGVDYVGGLIGNDTDSTIATSYATGNVTATQTNGNNAYAGGLVGAYTLVSASSGAITSSHASGAVTADGFYIGGLVGYNDANITSSYATGNVEPLGDGVTSFVGGLAGYNDGSITSSHATGTVIGQTSVGGLVGEDSGASAPNSGTIIGSYARGSVEIAFDNGNTLGGLVGYANGALIQNSYASGNVTVAPSITGVSAVGGLVGISTGTVVGSYFSGAVSVAPDTTTVGGLVAENDGIVDESHESGDITGGAHNIGGLVGLNFPGAKIENSYATGSVSASLDTVAGMDSDYIGGLVGENQGTILRSYATGAVSGNDVVGGLVGVNDSGAVITKSYATGTATATANPAVAGDGTVVGGLVGSAWGTLSYVYATGNVSGYDDVGGLIGSAVSGLTIDQAYSTGTVSASSSTPVALGASIGRNNGATVTDLYWDITNNPTLTGVGNGENSTTPLTTAQLMSGLPTGFSASVWGSSPSINNGLPYILGLAPG
jgi:filamentous hemagglutinin family protein